VVVDRIGGDAVRVAVRGHVLQPLPFGSVDHAENRTCGHVSRSQVVFVVARVVPSLIDGSNEIDRREDLPCGAIDDDRVG
jgi:hypothetical protein